VSVPLRRWLGPLAGGWLLVALLVAVSLAYTATGGGARDRQVTLMFIYVVIVVGLQIFVGNSGVFSLGHIAIAGVGAYAVAILSASPELKEITIPDAPLGLGDVELPLAVAVPAGVLVAVVVAFLVGLPVTRLAGLAAIIVTLALLVVLRTVLTNWDALTGGAEAFYGYPAIDSMWWPIGAAFLAVTVAHLFRGSPLGLRLQASREDELAAAAMGVDIVRSRLAAWVVSAAVVALGGALFALFLGAITPQEFFIHLTLLTLAMLVLGGMASVAGAVLGTAVVYMGSELTRMIGDGPTWAGVDLPQLFGLPTLFLGAVILVGMILRPEGLVGDRELHQLLAPLVSRVRRRAGQPAVAPAAGESRPPRGELRVRDVQKVFAGLKAVDGVSIEVRPGEVVGLIGPNGAGKTTLLNVITGVVPPTSGSIELDGRSLAGLPPSRIARRGVARTFQNIRLFRTLSVRDNVAVTASVAARHRAAAPEVDVLLARFDLTPAADRRASTLAYGQQRELELARAVALGPDLLLLDEPTAGMNNVETEHLMGLIRGLRDELGCAVVIVDHDLHFIMAVCETVYVMNEGRLIASGTPAEVQRDPAVVKAYLGTRVHIEEPAQPSRSSTA
jgi:branched-chain amino acid transport system permease protein